MHIWDNLLDSFMACNLSEDKYPWSDRFIYLYDHIFNFISELTSVIFVAKSSHKIKGQMDVAVRHTKHFFLQNSTGYKLCSPNGNIIGAPGSLSRLGAYSSLFMYGASGSLNIMSASGSFHTPGHTNTRTHHTTCSIIFGD